MQLRPYQIEDVNFLKDKNAVGIFNQQRTGKTPTALMFIKEKGIKKVLIVCPASLLYNWRDEFETWLQRPCVIIAGTKKQIQHSLDNWTDGGVISYDLLKKTSRYEGYVDDVLISNPEAVILDEAHRIKDTTTAQAQAVFRLVKTPVRLALTGTPAPNKPEEIYSILYWLSPTQFKSYWGFIGHYFNQYEIQLGNTGRSFKKVSGFKKGRDTELQLIMSQISTQRKRKEVMPWLPDKDYTQVRLDPTKEQLKYLTELTKYFETEHIITQGILDRLIRYRQVCLAPELLGLKGKSPKLEWVLQYLSDYPSKSVIIFSKFTSFIHVLEKKIKGAKCIVGATPIRERHEIVQDFQKGKFKVLLLNIDAGKEGLTLDKAETTIFTDKFPPVGDIEQAEDRFVATSEDKADKPHEIIELMIKGTYDEELYKLIKLRASELDVVNNYKKYLQERGL